MYRQEAGSQRLMNLSWVGAGSLAADRRRPIRRAAAFSRCHTFLSRERKRLVIHRRGRRRFQWRRAQRPLRPPRWMSRHGVVGDRETVQSRVMKTRAILCLIVAGASIATAQEADLIVRNARIWTGDSLRPRADAIAVRGERLL